MRKFEWYNDSCLGVAIEDLLDDIRNMDKIIGKPEQHYTEYQFPPYVPRSTVLSEIHKEVSTYLRDKDKPKTYSISGVLQSSVVAPQSQNFIVRLENERGLIDSLSVEVKNGIREIDYLLLELESNPESSNLVSLSIVGALLLFFFGVIVPLGFLPNGDAADAILPGGVTLAMLWWVKTGIVVTVSAIFTTIMVVFWRINSSLKYKPQDIDELRAFTKLDSYSKYLGIAEANTKEQVEWENHIGIANSVANK